MTEITQADRDRARKAVLSAAADIADGNRGGIDWLAIHFAEHRQIEITDAMIEAGAKEHYNLSHRQQWRGDTVKAIFNAMMGARS